MQTETRQLESDLVAYFTKWLGWDFHQEVPLVIDGQEVTVDAVCVDDLGDLAAYEAKQLLSDHLVKQCARLRAYAKWVYAVVKEPKSQGRTHTRCAAILKSYGIGLMYVTETGNVRSKIPAHPQVAQFTSDLRAALCEAQQKTKGGVPSPERIRPDSYDKVRDILKAHGGEMFVKQLAWVLDSMSMVEWREYCRKVRRGDVRGIKVDGTGLVHQLVEGDNE